jgi:hypothetical protein
VQVQVSKAVLRGNAGLLRFSQQDYSGALEDFEAAAAADPADSAAANNAAICQLLNTQVGAATSGGSSCRLVLVWAGREDHAKAAVPQEGRCNRHMSHRSILRACKPGIHLCRRTALCTSCRRLCGSGPRSC